jgi:hypothetical protein
MYIEGDLLHNKSSNEDGRVIGRLNENGALLYKVAVSLDSTSWDMGARESTWPESEVEASTNQFLLQRESA